MTLFKNEPLTIRQDDKVLQVMDGNRQVAEVPDDDNEDGEQLARLFAAAPKLLEACKALVRQLDHEGMENRVMFGAPLRSVRHAILRCDVKTGYRLSVSRPIHLPLAEDDVIVAAVGRDRDDSGAGFGQRDMGWEFQKLEEAVEARGRVQALPGAPDYTISITPLHR